MSRKPEVYLWEILNRISSVPLQIFLQTFLLMHRVFILQAITRPTCHQASTELFHI